MKRLWVFRSNIRDLEYYHQYTTLKSFKNNCHDYYLLFPIWLLENDYVNEVVIWRLSHKPKKSITFKVNKRKRFIQRWCVNFNETFNYMSPDISFFRGGFREYDNVIKVNPNHFGKKIYLGAGKRVFSNWGGNYDAYLIEDERDTNSNYNCIPFYKTASPYIFKPLNLKPKWDLCWPCNFTQLTYKGQKFFINQIAKNKDLQKLKIVHCGNRPNVGKDLCKRYNVNNIEFLGSIERPEMNRILNMSKFALNLSNLNDGCPRVSTEILMSGTPLILRDSVRLLKEFRQKGVINVNDHNISEQILTSIPLYKKLKKDVLKTIENELSFDNINQQNINLWKKI